MDRCTWKIHTLKHLKVGKWSKRERWKGMGLIQSRDAALQPGAHSGALWERRGATIWWWLIPPSVRRNKETHWARLHEWAICIRLLSHFSAETLQVRREWNQILLKERNCQPRIIYPPKLSFEYEGEYFFRHAEAEGIHHQKTSFTGNTQGGYSTWNIEQKLTNLWVRSSSNL